MHKKTAPKGGAILVALASLSGLAACGSKEFPKPVESEKASPGIVELTGDQVTAAKLVYAVAEQRETVGGLKATAQIEAAPGRLARVGSRVAGRVTQILKAEGDPVREGSVLAWIDAPDLAEATAQFLSSNAEALVARQIADREQGLFQKRISSEREWKQAEAEAIRAESAKQVAEGKLHSLGLSDNDLTKLNVEGHYNSSVALRSPLDGVVSARTADVGQVIQAGESLFEVVDVREVRLVVDVYESALAQVKVGQRVQVRTSSTGDRSFSGTVASIGAVVERNTRTVKLQVRLPNPDAALRPGTFATVQLGGLPSARHSGAVVIPESALQRDGDTTIVFVPAGPGKFARRAVQPGVAADSGWIVVTGVNRGDSVVVSGSFLLKSELRRGELGEEGE